MYINFTISNIVGLFMEIKVKKSYLFGEITCPPSKSYSHRAIIISSLTKGQSRIENVLLSRDTIASIRCSQMLGVDIEFMKHQSDNFSIGDPHYNNHLLSTKLSKNLDATEEKFPSQDITITSSGGENGFKTPDDVLNADNSGTTIRLLTSVCSLVIDGYSILTGDKSLRKRPMGDLIKSLNELGVSCFSSNSSQFPPLIIKGGGIRGGNTQISGRISSQFISSLLLSGIYSCMPITINVIGKQVSKPYIDSTIYTMNKFGGVVYNNSIEINKTELREKKQIPQDKKMNDIISEIYSIPTNFTYKPTTFRIPGDFSTAALLISAAILTDGELVIKNLDFSMPQGDMEIINIVKEMGGNIKTDNNKGMAKIIGSAKLEGGSFDLHKTPDLFPVIAILALKSRNKTVISGISHARYKETDRVSNISSQLTKFGAQIKEDYDTVVITPPTEIRNASINSFDDHRLFMAFTIAGLSTDKTIINGADSVDVSFPNFINELRSIGAQIESPLNQMP